MPQQERTIRTHSGIYIDVFDPDPITINLNDIATGLSHVARFAGQTPSAYSVGQHSIRVADIVHKTHPEWALEALMHDASEAYVQDIPSPIKRNLPDYVIMEKHLLQAIFNKFELKYPMDPIIKYADDIEFRYESRALHINRARGMDIMPASMVKFEFLKAFAKYKEEYDIRTKKVFTSDPN